jgi:hypothetical protein
MVNAFAPRLPSSVRRCGGSVAPYFANGAGYANIRIQCQLPEICEVFKEEFSSIMMVFPQYSLFASLRLRVNPLLSHGARRGFVYLTQRREEENNVHLGETF